MGRRGWGVVVVVAGVVIAGAGVLFWRLGLDDADKVSSGIGAVTGVLGLIIGVAGLVGARRGGSPTSAARPPAVGGHSVHVGGDVGGNVEISGSVESSGGRSPDEEPGDRGRGPCR